MTDAPQPPQVGSRGTVRIQLARALLADCTPDVKRLLLILVVCPPGSDRPLPPDRYQNEITSPLSRAQQELGFTYTWAYPDRLDIRRTDDDAIYAGMARLLRRTLEGRLVEAGYEVTIE
jgi:hypothetical protein